MSRRDDELKRLEQYAKALGLKVEYKKPIPRRQVGAEVVSVNGISTTLIMYVTPRMPKLTKILYFLHELGHQLAWIYKNRKDDPALIAALMFEDNRKQGDPPIPKELRKLIYQMEKEDSDFRTYVVHELNIKLPPKVLELDIKLDEWVYRQYYITGDYPKNKHISMKLSELREQLRGD